MTDSFPKNPATGSPSPVFDTSVPLGGVQPGPVEPDGRGPVRHLVLASLLFVAAVIAGAASTMPWRDMAWRGPNTTAPSGWTRLNDALIHGDTLGHGWITIILAMCLAGSGLLIAAWNERVGRITAVASGVGLMVLATAEWGLGSTGRHDGPGPGLWVQLLVGAAAVLAVGMIEPVGRAAHAHTV